jgi:hypothetical protein
MFCSKRKAAIVVGYGTDGPSIAKMPLQSDISAAQWAQACCCLD